MVASLLKILGGSGAQDPLLSAPVNINAFLKVWKKAGRFTTRWEPIDFISPANFGKTCYANINLRGEFITRLFVAITLPDIYTPQLNASISGDCSIDDVYPSFGWTNSIGHALIEYAAIEIDGVEYDRLNSQLLECLDEFWTPYEKQEVVNELIGRVGSGFSSKSLRGTAERRQKTVIVPLPFWFSRGDAAAALPIDALSKSTVRLKIKFRSLDGCYYSESRNLGISGAGSGSLFSTSDPNTTSSTTIYGASASCNFAVTDGSSLWPIRTAQFYKKTLTGIEVPGLLPPDAGTFVEPIDGSFMSTVMDIDECYVFAEYVYVDKFEAHTFRGADIKLPIIQHVEVPVISNNGASDMIMPLRIGNPARGIYFMAQRSDVGAYNAHFLATRDLANAASSLLWWPDACGGTLLPGFAARNSEPFKSVSLIYNGKNVRYETDHPSLFRAIMPALECVKAPWLHKYYYTMRFGIGGSNYPTSAVNGAANLDKIGRVDMRFSFNPVRGTANVNNVPNYNIRVWVETYNIFRIIGGRGTLMFAG